MAQQTATQYPITNEQLYPDLKVGTRVLATRPRGPQRFPGVITQVFLDPEEQRPYCVRLDGQGIDDDFEAGELEVAE